MLGVMWPRSSRSLPLSDFAERCTLVDRPLRDVDLSPWAAGRWIVVRAEWRSSFVEVSVSYELSRAGFGVDLLSSAEPLETCPYSRKRGLWSGTSSA